MKVAAAKEAGRQLVEDGKMSPETLAIVSRKLLPLETWVRGDSREWKSN